MLWLSPFNECEGKLALLRTEDNVILTHPSCSSFSSFLLFPLLFLLIFIVFPLPPHFYCFPSSSTFILFSLLHHHHISVVFPPPPQPPEPHFYCFSSSTTTTTIKIISIVFPPPPPPSPPHSYSTRPYLNEIPAHFIHEIKTKGYDVTGVNVFHRTWWPASLRNVHDDQLNWPIAQCKTKELLTT